MKLTLKISSFLVGCLLLCVSAAPLPGQTAHATPAAAIASPAGANSSDMTAEDLMALDGFELPQRGFNAFVAFSGLHDAQLGWASFVQPTLSYRFNRIFSADVTIPIYLYRMAYRYRAGQPVNGKLTPQSGELGDTTFAGHAEFTPAWLDDTFTAAIDAPTGNKVYGLSTGQVTWMALNDFEVDIRRFTPDIQLGVGDSSDLVNQAVVRNYDTLGTLAYFQAGGAYNVASHLDVEGDAYEQLPIGNQKIYTQVIRKTAIGVSKTQVLSNSSAEDNGITATVDIPTKGHWDISSYYNRSFRLKDTTVGFTLTFSLKKPKEDTSSK